jgi:uncharacterized heparinase superfamily protein
VTTLRATELGRLWRTVRWLRIEQVLGRLRSWLQRPTPDLRPPPPLRAATGAWVTPAAREASLVGATRWRLLAEEHDLADIGWDDPALALLWRYNQHYFDDLNAAGAAERRPWQRALLTRWCQECPPARGTGWAPYPTSLRVVNWLKWYLSGEILQPEWLHSLAVQSRWLMRHIEWHLLGNHLFANAKALVFAGLVFDGSEADAWLERGLDIIERELPEQFLPDGAQFERTPMYHALGLEDLLDLLNVVQARAPSRLAAVRLIPALRQRGAAGLHWLRCLRLPGGALARFNDCAEGIAPAADVLEHYAAALGVAAPGAPGPGMLMLQPSGYARVERGAAVALLDLAPIGPDYLPGHAHADTLSFELSLHGREIIVNRGTSVYGTGPRRQVERGTAAHSTLQIGAHDSSEVWAGFRVGRRARPSAVRQEGWVIEGSHDGYAHLTGGPLHRRRWQFDPAALVVEDQILPPPREAARARYHLAPGLALQGDSTHWQVLDTAGSVLARAEVLAGLAGREAWQHAARFGMLVHAETLTVNADADGHAHVRWTW